MRQNELEKENEKLRNNLENVMQDRNLFEAKNICNYNQFFF